MLPIAAGPIVMKALPVITKTLPIIIGGACTLWNGHQARKQAHDDAMLALGVVTGVALLGGAVYATKKTVETGIDLVNKHILKDDLNVAKQSKLI